MIEKRLGSGWTGEVYKAREVMTDAVRAMKIFTNHSPGGNSGKSKPHESSRDFAHCAWVLEEFSIKSPGLFPTYFHFGHAFLPPKKNSKAGDNDYVSGNYYIIQEYLKGKILTANQWKNCEKPLVENLIERMLHARAKAGLAVGDMNQENILLTGTGTARSIRIIDCEYGRDEAPNNNFDRDITKLGKLFGPWAKEFYQARWKKMSNA